MNDQNQIISLSGESLSSEENSTTSRELERRKEDQDYVPVILKRTDEAVRHPDDILQKAIEEGVEQHNRTKLSLLLSAVAAGLILGFAGLCVALANQWIPMSEGLWINRVASAVVYPLGFIVCIMSGTQLFTEQTATAVYPVLDKQAQVTSLMTLWLVILTGNLIGTFLSSYLIFSAEGVIQAKEGFLSVYEHLIHYSNSEVFVSSILAGWLMAQGGWLVMATPPASSQIICIYIVTFIIGLGGLHHSIAGSAEIFGGLFHNANPDYGNSIRFLAFAILGNLFGGSIFVGVLNYGHIRKTK